jgi:hypothetical protein
MARFGPPRSAPGVSETAAVWDPRLCYHAGKHPEPIGGLNLDHQAWNSMEPFAEPEPAVPNNRNLHPSNDWSNLAIQKHRDKHTGLLRPTKTVNKHMLQVSSDLPEFMCAQALDTKQIINKLPGGKRSFASSRNSGNGNPIAHADLIKNYRKPKIHRMRTPYAQKAAVMHDNDFNVKHRQYDQITANNFYGSTTGGWGGGLH